MEYRSCHCDWKQRIGTNFRRARFGLAACVVLAGSACRDATSPADFLPGLSIRTGAETLHFVPWGSVNLITVPITLTNDSDKTLNLAWCSEQLERISLSGWKTVYSPVCIAALQTLPPIPAGTSLTFDFHASDAPFQYPGFRFTESPNVYRVRLGLWIVDDQKALPREASVTNPFRVEP